MASSLHSWWCKIRSVLHWLRKKIQKHRVSIGVIAIVLIVLIALIIVGYKFDWTGFNGYYKVTTTHIISGSSSSTVTRTEEYQPGKTLWDWLGLFIIPIVVVGVGSWFGRQQGKAQEKATTQQQYKDALQTFWDNMSKLILDKDKNLLHAGKGSPVREIARTQTLVTLSRLSGSRNHKAALLLFLHEANLIKNPDPIISLSPTSGGERSQGVAKTIVAHWNGANLQGADLHDACLYQIDFRDAILSNASLSGANLEDTVLRGADLQLADLTGTSLKRADLSSANLAGANLTGATVTNEQLSKAKSLQGATMPDGSIHP